MFTKVKAFAKRAKNKLMAVGASALVAMSTMAMTAFASEGTNTEAVDVELGGIVQEILGIFTTVIDWFFKLVTTNSILMIFFVGGLVFMGVGVVKAIIKAVKKS